MTPLDIALGYIARGWNPVPIPLRSKKPTDNAWQKRQLDAATAPRVFNGGAQNIGVQMGPASRGLSDVDLDAAEAVVIGPYLLPTTAAIFGRPSKRASHRLYYTDLGATHDSAAAQFKAPDGTMLVEIRIGGGGKGAQTVFPGSVHESGELIAWEQDGEPARIAGDELLAEVKLAAAAALIARHWPVSGSRHDAACCLGGLLARINFSEQQIKLVTEAIARAAGDIAECKDRVTAARDAARGYQNGGHAYGMPQLINIVGKPAAKKIAEWIGYDARVEHDRHSGKRNDNSEREAISLEDFHAYLPQHKYIFAPTSDLWPTASVNARLPPVPVLDGNGKQKRDDKDKPEFISASNWLDHNRRVEQMTWAPGRPQLIKRKLVCEGGFVDQPDCSAFNLYRPPTIKPVAGDVTPWLELVRKVYPNEAGHIICWLAHRVQRPHEKINHALVLGGKPGIGKDTILVPVREAVGAWNFADVSPQEVLGSFCGFRRSVIIRINEARDLGEFDRYTFHDHMKVLVTTPPEVLRVNEKHLKEYYILNLCGIIITTNHKTDGLYFPADDRRHFVAWSILESSAFTEDYWKRMYRWFDDGGNERVAAYLAAVDLTSFDPKAPPPKTGAFWEIVNAHSTPEDTELADVLDALDNPDIVTTDAVAKRAETVHPMFAVWLRDRSNRTRIPFRFESCGYVVVTNPNDKTTGRWKIANVRYTIYGRNDLDERVRLAAAFKFTGAR
jgi:hypothetical protein